VLRRLGRLELHRLVRRTPHGWTRCTEQDAVHLLTLAAVHEQSDGAGDRQRARHAAERTQQREQHERWVAHLRAEHRRELLEHAVREPDDELVPVARELAPAGGWAPPDELVAELARLGQVVRSSALDALAEHGGHSLTAVQDALAGPLAQLQAAGRTVQRMGEAVARWAAEHEDELQAERELAAAQGVDGG
jgi:hypothetical protein